MEPFLSVDAQKSFIRDLFSWYRKSGRHNMAWRKTADPYRVFVSEIMLQQTTVATVGPYYDRFIARFPSVEALASAQLDDVLALWSGLGYYARARNLWAAMKQVQDEFGGRIPSEPNDLMKLPGVGFYTAGAIATIAFNRPAAVLDGNITRVLMRVFAIEEDPRLKAVQAVLRKASLDWTTLAFSLSKKPRRSRKDGPRDLVLSLFDLGATVCVPRAPECDRCPVNKYCMARQVGAQERIPPPREAPDRPVVRTLHAVIRHEGKWLLARRPEKGLFGGLWEFPGSEVPPATNPVLHLEAEVEKEAGLKIRVQEALPSFTHVLTHREMVVRPYLCEIDPKYKGKIRLKKSTDNYVALKWIRASDTNDVGLSAVTKRILDLVSRSKGSS